MLDSAKILSRLLQAAAALYRSSGTRCGVVDDAAKCVVDARRRAYSDTEKLWAAAKKEGNPNPGRVARADLIAANAGFKKHTLVYERLLVRWFVAEAKEFAAFLGHTETVLGLVGVGAVVADFCKV